MARNTVVNRRRKVIEGLTVAEPRPLASLGCSPALEVTIPSGPVSEDGLA
jgi:hypothetical protein